jgi:arsenate reductase
MHYTVLFICPHSAAKSVLASAYFQQMADKRQLPWQAHFAGTDPDAALLPKAVALLRDDGLDVSAWQPRRVTADELQNAWRVVSLGCEPTELPSARADLIRWDDVPPVSQNAPAARDAIRAHVERLVDELARTLPKETA